jgi:DNA polymerase-3 subunit epsilon
MTFLNIIRSNDFVVLDTETTGLKRPAEIVQIAIIDSRGKTLIDTLVHPVNPIPEAAAAIHHITDEDVKYKPSWAHITLDLQHMLKGRNVVVYNAVFDRQMMHLSAEAAHLPKVEWKALATFRCAMEAYAEFYGSWNEHFQTYTWQSLTNAMRQQRLPMTDAHTALGDCVATLALVQHMARQRPTEVYDYD